MTFSEDESLVLRELQQSRTVLDDFINQPNIATNLATVASEMANAIRNGHKIIACGNGGSHADAIHFAQELTGRFRDDRQPLPAIAISDAAHLTCTANDYGFEEVFARYVRGVGQSGDVLLAITTSGNSPNIIRAVATAKKVGMKTILLSGNGGGSLAGQSDHEVIVPHFGNADRIQEVHIKIIHIFILLIERYTSNLK
jgi:D-sedoheptulose 7-phosphate isomerase